MDNPSRFARIRRWHGLRRMGGGSGLEPAALKRMARLAGLVVHDGRAAEVREPASVATGGG